MFHTCPWSSLKVCPALVSPHSFLHGPLPLPDSGLALHRCWVSAPCKCSLIAQMQTRSQTYELPPKGLTTRTKWAWRTIQIFQLSGRPLTEYPAFKIGQSLQWSPTQKVQEFGFLQDDGGLKSPYNDYMQAVYVAAIFLFIKSLYI